MKNAKIVLVAQWDGWCGACAVERPLVLTRSGRLSLRTWLTVPVAETRPLTLTCRLCGCSTVVPPEQDDPPVLVEPDDDPEPLVTSPLLAAAEAAVPAPLAPQVLLTTTAGPVTPAPVVVPATSAPSVRAEDGPELDRARGALGAALGALLVQRTAEAGRVTPAPSVVPHVPAVAAPALPLQRSSSSDTDSLATLQLLADGLDLLSSTRA